jgi:hypothetical protein
VVVLYATIIIDRLCTQTSDAHTYIYAHTHDIYPQEVHNAMQSIRYNKFKKKWICGPCCGTLSPCGQDTSLQFAQVIGSCLDQILEQGFKVIASLRCVPRLVWTTRLSACFRSLFELFLSTEDLSLLTQAGK